MGGSALKTVGNIGSNVFTLGGAQIAKNNLGSRSPITQALNTPGTILTGGAYGPTGMPSLFGGGNGPNPYVSGPFSLDPAQMAADQGAITGLGKSQYDQTMGQIPTDVANAIQQENPQIMENLNSGGLLNSSAYPQEIARQQSYLTQNLALPAMQALQGTQTAGLQRGLSLEDFINSANVSKSIGASMAPQPPSSKAQAGTTMQGIGAMAPWAKVGKAAAPVAAAAV